MSEAVTTNSVDSMIDSFVDGAEAPSTNLKFTLTKDQLDKIKDTFKPLQFETNIRFELTSAGKIIVASKDKAVDVWVELSTVEMDLHGEDYQSFYIDRNRINKFAEVCNGSIEFSVCDGEMEVKIGSTDLHITLPVYELPIDSEFKSSKTEAMMSDVVADLCSRCFASKATGPFALATATLADKWYYGNTESVTVVDKGFTGGMSVNVNPAFLDYINNLTFTKEEIVFHRDEDTQTLTVTSENVYYKTNLQPTEFEDVTQLFEEASIAEFTMSTTESIGKLALLSIPLVGMDNAQFFINLEEGKSNLAISVCDEANKTSYDSWTPDRIKGHFHTSLGIKAYLTAVGAMSQEAVTASVKDSCIILNDTVQSTILIARM